MGPEPLLLPRRELHLFELLANDRNPRLITMARVARDQQKVRGRF